MSFEKIIKDYLVGMAGSDAVFAGKFYDRMDKEGDKAIDGCCAYITAEAKKKAVKGCAVIADDEVFGWAVHYFDEGLNAPEEEIQCKVETTADPDVMRAKVQIPKPTPKPKKADEAQMSLFDFDEE